MNICDWNFAQFQITLFKRVLQKSTLAIYPNEPQIKLGKGVFFVFLAYFRFGLTVEIPANYLYILISSEHKTQTYFRGEILGKLKIPNSHICKKFVAVLLSN